MTRIRWRRVGQWLGLLSDRSTRPRVGTRGWWLQSLFLAVVIAVTVVLVPRLFG